MKTILTTDWSPRIEQAVRAIAPVLVAVYCAGWALGKWLHRTSGRLAQLWVRLLVPVQPVSFADVATPANVAPPMLVHISDPMARAVRLVRDGKSQRLAASICGVSRSSLQRALKA